VRCSHPAKKTTGRKFHIRSQSDADLFTQAAGKTFVIGDYVCEKCRLNLKNLVKIYKYQNTPSTSKITESYASVSVGDSDDDDNDDDDDDKTLNFREVKQLKKHDELIELPFDRLVATHKYCCICFKHDTKIKVVPLEARLQCFSRKRVFIPPGNRCCTNHLINKRFLKTNSTIYVLCPIRAYSKLVQFYSF